MEEIGGFLPFELPPQLGGRRFASAIALDSARNCLRYFLLSGRRPARVCLPRYCCDVVYEPFREQGIELSFYDIDRALRPILVDFDSSRDWIVYTNYFGSCDHIARELVGRFPRSVILDNAQAYFSDVQSGLCTVFSPRKFFGVPDGGYLTGQIDIQLPSPMEQMPGQAMHLLVTLDQGVRAGAELSRAHDDAFGNDPKGMSRLTRCVLGSTDQNRVRIIREANWRRLHDALGMHNLISLESGSPGPQSYPFLVSLPGLKDFLQENRVLLPTYWTSVLARVAPDSFQATLVRELVVLPVDQRYDANAMDRLITLVERFRNEVGTGRIKAQPSRRMEYW